MWGPVESSVLSQNRLWAEPEAEAGSSCPAGGLLALQACPCLPVGLILGSWRRVSTASHLTPWEMDTESCSL